MDQTSVIKEARVSRQNVDSVNLELLTSLQPGRLSVFVRDPESPQQYWFRRLEIEEDGGYINVKSQNLGEFTSIPCPINHLQIAVRNMIGYEEEIGTRKEPGLDIKAAVGTAEYRGTHKVSFDHLINLVAAKYLVMFS